MATRGSSGATIPSVASPTLRSKAGCGRAGGYPPSCRHPARLMTLPAAPCVAAIVGLPLVLAVIPAAG